jgi:hypothetical protein
MATLSTKQRNNLRKSQFAIPSQRKYPINDLAHAKNALARVAQSGTPSQKAQVKAAVYKKFPSLKHK